MIVNVFATAPFGSNVTVKVHEAPFARLDVHEVESVKLVVAPVVEIVSPVTAAAVLLVSVAVFAADFSPTSSFPNASVDGLNAIVPLAATPVPLATSVCVPALSFTEIVSVFATAPFGSNVTEKVHEAPFASVVAQLFDSVKLLVAPVNDTDSP